RFVLCVPWDRSAGEVLGTDLEAVDGGAVLAHPARRASLAHADAGGALAGDEAPELEVLECVGVELARPGDAQALVDRRLAVRRDEVLDVLDRVDPARPRPNLGVVLAKLAQARVPLGAELGAALGIAGGAGV